MVMQFGGGTDIAGCKQACQQGRSAGSQQGLFGFGVGLAGTDNGVHKAMMRSKVNYLL